MTSHNDTIAAISTPVGTGGISVIRISGDNCFDILKAILDSKTPIDEFESHNIYFSRIHSENQLIDEVLVSVFISPRSYTGEDVIEISCHGGRFLTQRVLETVLAAGARLAQPGEFTKRAFLNGKIDLTEAESVIDLIEAKTKKSQQAAIHRLQGKLHKDISSIIGKISALRTEIELDIDFSDQGLQQTTSQDIIRKAEAIYAEITSLVNSGDEGIILNEGFRVVIAGEPNSGKSTLFNKIMENERSIVTDIPGTTRDYIEEDISLQGYLLKLFDTAGLSKTKDIVGHAGIKKSYDIISKSHLILWVEDITQKTRKSIPIKVKNKDYITVKNKVDLLNSSNQFEQDNENVIFISALKDAGISQIKSRIIQRVDLGKYDTSHGLISNTRQLAAAKKCQNRIKQAIQAARDNKGLEFIAFDLRDASEALEEIIGKITKEEIINSIFDRFCVGK